MSTVAVPEDEGEPCPSDVKRAQIVTGELLYGWQLDPVLRSRFQ